MKLLCQLFRAECRAVTYQTGVVGKPDNMLACILAECSKTENTPKPWTCTAVDTFGCVACTEETRLICLTLAERADTHDTNDMLVPIGLDSGYLRALKAKQRIGSVVDVRDKAYPLS